jgi:hypothetical protein
VAECAASVNSWPWWSARSPAPAVAATIDKAKQSCAVTVTTSTLPGGWAYNELNAPPIPGAITVNKRTFALTGCGRVAASWWQRIRDRGSFVSQPGRW